MKNIIVGIDFSECSYNAMEHALSMAMHFGDKLTLLYVLSPDAKIFDEYEKKVVKNDLENFVKAKLEELVAECKLKYEHVEYKIRIAGKVFKEINAEAVEQGNAIIFVGTHGSSGVEEIFIGSSAFKVVSYSEVPVITIRMNNAISTNMTDMLLLFDDNRETLQKVKLSAKLAKAFNAKVHLLGLYSSRNASTIATVNSYVKRAETFMIERNIRVSADFMPSTTDPSAFLDYAREHKINLIVLVKEIELYADKVFALTSFNEKIVNRSQIPILTIPVDMSIYGI